MVVGREERAQCPCQGAAPRCFLGIAASIWDLGRRRLCGQAAAATGRQRVRSSVVRGRPRGPWLDVPGGARQKWREGVQLLVLGFWRKLPRKLPPWDAKPHN